MALRVALNGFGRIGRHIFREHYGNRDFKIVAINDLVEPEIMAYLLKYDSVYGKWDKDVTYDDDNIIVGKQKTRYTRIKEIENLPWKKDRIDLVIEATGVWTKRVDLMKHLDHGPLKVVLTAPAKKGEFDYMVVIGCNDVPSALMKAKIISNASCTTNCFGPMVKVLKETFGIKDGLMTTIHAYTATQSILDIAKRGDVGEKKRRLRAAAINVVPTTTGAARAIGNVFPELDGKLDAMAFRVPVPTASVVDFVCNLKKPATVDKINAAFKSYADKQLKGILRYSTEQLVSTDIIGDTHSCVFDSNSTLMMGDMMSKTIAWYDNEWGYSRRIVDLIQILSNHWPKK